MEKRNVFVEADQMWSSHRADFGQIEKAGMLCTHAREYLDHRSGSPKALFEKAKEKIHESTGF